MAANALGARVKVGQAVMVLRRLLRHVATCATHFGDSMVIDGQQTLRASWPKRLDTGASRSLDYFFPGQLDFTEI